jgi:ribA/ribD-fused uncharacterized protein
MLKGLRAKFSQNNNLSALLINTKNIKLEENSSWDSYWGIGKNGNGKNRMGYLLSTVRSELQNNNL